MSEAFLTTVIGSLPKPRWLMQRNPVHDQGAKQVHGKGADWALEGAALEEALDDAVRIAVHDQVAAGIDIISDGEHRRKSWMTYVTARMEGFDYDNLVEEVDPQSPPPRTVRPVRRRRPARQSDPRAGFSFPSARVSRSVQDHPGPARCRSPTRHSMPTTVTSGHSPWRSPKR